MIPSDASPLAPAARVLAAISMAASLAACTTYMPNESEIPPTARPMRGDEIRAAFSTTVTLKDAFPGSDGFRHEFRPDGRWTVRTGLPINPTGNWRVDGDRLCLSLRLHEDCAKVYRIDDDRLYAAFDGWSREHSTLRVER